MIQFRRGKTKNWRNSRTILAAGQPGYDKDKHKIKIGDGERTWSELPYASGLSSEEILCSEEDAKSKNRLDFEDSALITYGPDTPNKNTVGQLYLQSYDTDPEVDYVVSSGVNGIWTYQKWYSGKADCWGTITLDTDIATAFDGVSVFHDDSVMKSVPYPFTFKPKDDNTPNPVETATLQSSGSIVWLASRKANTVNKSAVYSLISAYKVDRAKYRISLRVEGFWK